MLKPNIPSIKSHLNLIEATQVLVAENHIASDAYSAILPIQIRLHEDRIQLVNSLLQAKPVLYKKRDFLIRLAVQLLGVSSLSSRELFLIAIFIANTTIREKYFDDSYTIGCELVGMIPEFPGDSKEIGLFWEFLVEFLKSDYNNMNKKLLLLSASSKHLPGSKSGCLMQSWRSTLAKISVGSSEDPLEIFSSVGKLYDSFSASSPSRETHVTSPLSVRNQKIDFFQPVGSPVSNHYFKRSFLKSVEAKDSFSCLKIQNSIRQLDLLSEEQQGIHALAMAKSLISVDAPISISYLLTVKTVSQSCFLLTL